MSFLRRCTACGSPTMMLNCPKCQGDTSTYTNSSLNAHAKDAASRYTDSSSRACILEKDAIGRYSSLSPALSIEPSAPVKGRSESGPELVQSVDSNETLKKIVHDLVQENIALHDELRKNKDHMMHSAVEILSLHDNANASRRSGLELIERLLSDNRELRQQLTHLGSPLVGNSLEAAQISAAPVGTPDFSHLSEPEERNGVSRVSSTKSTLTAEDNQQSLAKAQIEITKLQRLLEEKNLKIHWITERARKAEEALDKLVTHLNVAETTTQAGGEAYKVLDRYAIEDLVVCDEADHFLSASLAKSYEKHLQRHNDDQL